MTWPTSVTVEINFRDNPLNHNFNSDNWQNVTADVISPIQITRGRQSELEAYSAGTCGFTLMNRDRKYDFEYTSSPYNGFIIPRVRCRVRAVFASTTYDLFTGFVQGWPQSYDNVAQISTVDIQAIDVFDILAQRQWIGGASETYLRELIRPFRAFFLTNEGGGSATDNDQTSFVRDAYEFHGTDHLHFYGNARANGSVDDANGVAPSPEVAGGTVARFDRFGFAYSNTVGVTPGQSWTVGFWVQCANLRAHNYQRITDIPILRMGTSLDIRVSIAAAANIQSHMTVLFTDTGANQHVQFIGPVLADDTWHHVVITSEPNDINIYFDGIKYDKVLNPSLSTAGVTSWNYDASHTCDDFTGLWLGGFPDVTYQYLLGHMFHVFTCDYTMDPSTIAALYQAAIGWPSQRSDSRISEMLHIFELDISGVPPISLDTGYGIMQKAESFSGTLLDALQEVAQAEGGFLFVDGQGTLTFKHRYTMLTSSRSTIVQATFGDSGTDIRYLDATPVLDLQFLYNFIPTSIKGGPVYNAEDVTSINAYEVRSLDRTGLPMNNTNDAISSAQWYIFRSSTLNPRLPTVTYSARYSSAAMTAALDLKLLDMITVRRKPQNVGASQWSFDTNIEGLDYSIDLQALQFQVTYYLTQYNPVSGFLFADDVVNHLDVGKLAW